MPRLLAPEAVSEKLAALQSADAWGRELAQWNASIASAEIAGQARAHEDFEKEAGVLSRIGGAIKGKLVARAGRKQTASLAKRLPAPAKVAPKPTGPSVSLSPGGMPKPVASAAPAATAAPAAGYAGPTIRKPGQAAAPTVRKGKKPPAAAPAPKIAPGPAAAAPAAATKAKPKKKPSAREASDAAIAKAKGQAGKKSKKGITATMWKHRKPLAGAAAVGGAYTAYKAVPWAARQLEQASTTPMAYGGGWSPVPYGYGYSPYGRGVPTMGRGG